MNTKEKLSLTVMNFSRKHFRNTWVHRIPLTSKIYQKIFLSTFSVSEKEIFFRNHKYIVPTADTTVVPSMISGDYESFELDVFKKLLNKGDNILDIGANLGVYGIEASSIIGGNGTVYCFEPVPENQVFLKNNVNLNKIKNIKIVRSAIGDKVSSLKIFLVKNSIGTHSAGGGTDNFVDVPVTTIDNFVDKNKIDVNLIKIDIEGYEDYAIKGGLKTLKNLKPILFIEFSANHLRKCNTDPVKHANTLFNLYENCYLINERKKSVTKINNPSEFSNMLNVNLILSNKKLSFHDS
jgi:FkbM family methyltransferase